MPNYTRKKMIFAAAGSVFGLSVFPANSLLTETIAVTGLDFSASTSHTDLENAWGNHKGSIVDFGVYVKKGGSNTVSTQLDDGTAYAWSNDASAATATCAGIAALVWSVNPQAHRDQVFSYLRQAASMGNNRDSDFGWGVIDAQAAAVIAAAPPPPPLVVFLTGPGIIPASIQSDGTYTWTTSISGATSQVTYQWNGGPPSNSSAYSQFVSVPSQGASHITIEVTVTEQGGAGRSASASLFVPIGGAGGGFL